MATNRWQVGALYPPGGLNNIAWRQPDGVGGLVYPQDVSGGGYFEVTPFNERTSIFTVGCGHGVNSALVQREYDYNTNQSVALICCEKCGFVQATISPFENALNTVEYPWLVI